MTTLMITKKKVRNQSVLPRNFGSLKTSISNNLEETKIVNLGDPECVKEIKISIHLNEAQRKDLIHLIAGYVDVFVLIVRDMQGLSTDVVSHKLPINLGFNPVK